MVVAQSRRLVGRVGFDSFIGGSKPSRVLGARFRFEMELDEGRESDTRTLRKDWLESRRRLGRQSHKAVHYRQLGQYGLWYSCIEFRTQRETRMGAEKKKDRRQMPIRGRSSLWADLQTCGSVDYSGYLAVDVVTNCPVSAILGPTRTLVGIGCFWWVLV